MSNCPFQAFDDCQEYEEDEAMCRFGNNCPFLSRGNCKFGHTDEEIDEAYLRAQRAEDEARQPGKKASQPTGSARQSPMKTVCEFFLKGTCKFGDECKNEHPVICTYFLKGTCKFGHECKNEHPDICMYFLDGKCKFGKQCRNAHII